MKRDLEDLHTLFYTPQFLTRTEHLEAHDGNWRNPTNWYFNPVTKEKIDFGDGKYIPCPVIKLTEPIVIADSSQEKATDVAEKETKKDIAEKNETPIKSPPKVVKHPERVSFGEKAKSVFKTCVDAVIEFPTKHPTATKVIKWVGIAAASTYAVVESTKDSSNSSSRGSYGSDDDLYSDDGYEYEYSTGSDEGAKEHASPEEHMVRGHGQHYHTKDGVIWKEKDPFPRGGKKDE